MGSDAVDNAVMGENSRYQQRLQAAMEQGGLSREDAEKQLLLEDIRSAGSISPFVSGLMLHGADWGMRMLGDMDVISEAQRMAEEQNPKPYTDQDMEIARIMQDEAGSNPLGEKNDISIEDAAAKMAGGDSSGSAVVNSRGQDYTGDTDDGKIMWDSWQNYEKVEFNGRLYAKVGDRLYSRHAVNRMQPSGNRFGPNIYQGIDGPDYGRSVAPQFVEDVIASVEPARDPKTGNLSYVSDDLEIITNPEGCIVTIMTYKEKRKGEVK